MYHVLFIIYVLFALELNTLAQKLIPTAKFDNFSFMDFDELLSKGKNMTLI